jgi:hypothetical protein
MRASERTLEEIRARVAVDTPYFARTCAHILPKNRKLEGGYYLSQRWSSFDLTRL